ncbi:MAG TPA: GDP-mannose 4,6-dehydratase [Bacteroidota bacterium]|nr:GDP-mannose 4,6-dehydratase [Bacteroidota bacterium]
MNVLVTGIDGFVGSHLAEALLQKTGINLSGIIRDKTPTENIGSLLPRIQCIQTDITDYQQIWKILDSLRPEKVFHLAGQAFVPHSLDDPLQTFHTNINGTLNVLEAARQLTLSQKFTCSVLVVSSGEVYGAVSSERLPIKEEESLNPTNPYAASKASIDLIAQQYRKSFGLNVVVVRPFNHLGPRQSEIFVGSAFAQQVAEIKLKKRQPKIFVGNLYPERDFTDVRDVVQAYIELLDHPQPHAVYNVCSEKAVELKALLTMMLEIAGIESDILPDPRRQRSQEIQRIVGSAARLRDATGWAPKIPLRDTIKDLLLYWEGRISHSS